MAPKITVLMPVYNGLKWIEDSVKSILKQTFKDFEFIIIDDGSSDGTSNYLKRLTDSRIIIVYQEENQGIVSALNKGIKLAKGKYIARMDADDISFPTRLESQFNFLEQNKEYVLVASNIETFTHETDIKGGIIQEFQEWYNSAHSDEEIRKTLPIGNCLNHPSVMFRSESILATGLYKPQFQLAEDYELFIRLSGFGKMYKLTERLLKYRIHSNQLSSTYNQKQRLVDAKIKATYLKNHVLLARDSNILIWGAGNGGQLLYHAITEEGYKVKGFVDKDMNKWGKMIEGVKVHNPEDIQDWSFDFIIIASQPGREEATHFLESLQLVYSKDFIPFW
ncbi:glycosyltransferase [Bacillus sp. AK128]